MWIEVACGQRQGSEHTVVAQDRASQNCCVICHAYTTAYDRLFERNVGDVECIVSMRIDVYVVAEAHPIMKNDPADIVYKYVSVDHHIVADLDVVPNRHLDVLKDFEVAPDTFEDPRGQHSP